MRVDSVTVQGDSAESLFTYADDVDSKCSRDTGKDGSIGRSKEHRDRISVRCGKQGADWTEGLDREQNRVGNEVEREERKDANRDSVSELFSFGSIAESEDNLKRDEPEICAQVSSVSVGRSVYGNTAYI